MGLKSQNIVPSAKLKGRHLSAELWLCDVEPLLLAQGTTTLENADSLLLMKSMLCKPVLTKSHHSVPYIKRLKPSKPRAKGISVREGLK